MLVPFFYKKKIIKMTGINKSNLIINYLYSSKMFSNI